MSDELRLQAHMKIVQAVNVTWRSWIEPLAAIHLNPELEYDLPHGNRLYLYALRGSRGVHPDRRLHQLREPGDRARRRSAPARSASARSSAPAAPS